MSSSLSRAESRRKSASSSSACSTPRGRNSSPSVLYTPRRQRLFDENGSSVMPEAITQWQVFAANSRNLVRVDQYEDCLGLAGKPQFSDAKFNQLIRVGIPPEFRAEFWMECSGVRLLTLRQPELYEDALAAADARDSDCGDWDAIEKDLDRAGENCVKLHSEFKPRLRKILRALAVVPPGQGYTQGLHMIVGAFLIAGLPECDTFFLVHRIITEYFPLSFCDGVPGQLADVDTLLHYCKFKAPVFAKLMDEYQVDLRLNAFTIFGSLGFSVLPWSSVFLMLDRLFSGGVLAYFQTILRIFQHVAIQTMDQLEAENRQGNVSDNTRCIELFGEKLGQLVDITPILCMRLEGPKPTPSRPRNPFLPYYKPMRPEAFTRRRAHNMRFYRNMLRAPSRHDPPQLPPPVAIKALKSISTSSADDDDDDVHEGDSSSFTETDTTASSSYATSSVSISAVAADTVGSDSTASNSTPADSPLVARRSASSCNDADRSEDDAHQELATLPPPPTTNPPPPDTEPPDAESLDAEPPDAMRDNDSPPPFDPSAANGHAAVLDKTNPFFAPALEKTNPFNRGRGAPPNSPAVQRLSESKE